jgi:predicted RNA-binding protein (virulence factor B family)
MQKLEEAGGFLPYGDHSDPEEIRREFGMSKKTFKKILGTLFREGKILLSDEGFRKN